MNKYSERFSDRDIIDVYLNKFKHKIDRIRHTIELNLLKKYAYGDCFDCSIGTGRFVNQLLGVKSYCGMDYSLEFVNYIRKTFPDVEVIEGDLVRGIEAPDERYDTTLCIRTLFALDKADEIVGEMARITKRGGLVIFDYGKKSTLTELGEGTMIDASRYNIGRIIKEVDLTIVATHRLDSCFIRAIKTNRLWSLVFHSRFNIIGDSFYLFIEKFLSRLNGNRKLYVLGK